MRKQLARRFAVIHCRRLVLHFRPQPRFIDMQYDEVVLPSIKPVSSVDHLRNRRAMYVPFRAQISGRVSPARNSERPFTALDDMADHVFAGASWCIMDTDGGVLRLRQVEEQYFGGCVSDDRHFLFVADCSAVAFCE